MIQRILETETEDPETRNNFNHAHSTTKPARVAQNRRKSHLAGRCMPCCEGDSAFTRDIRNGPSAPPRGDSPPPRGDSPRGEWPGDVELSSLLSLSATEEEGRRKRRGVVIVPVPLFSVPDPVELFPRRGECIGDDSCCSSSDDAGARRPMRGDGVGDATGSSACCVAPGPWPCGESTRAGRGDVAPLLNMTVSQATSGDKPLCSRFPCCFIIALSGYLTGQDRHTHTRGGWRLPEASTPREGGGASDQLAYNGHTPASGNLGKSLFHREKANQLNMSHLFSRVDQITTTELC